MSPKLKAPVRILVGALSLALWGTLLIGYMAASSINDYYFGSSTSIGSFEVLWALAATYLLMVALVGRWVPRRTTGQP